MTVWKCMKPDDTLVAYFAVYYLERAKTNYNHTLPYITILNFI